VTARRPDQDRHLADLDPADSVPQHDPLGTESLARGPLEGRQLFAGWAEMGLVVEGLHTTAIDPVGSHAAGE